MRYATRKVLIIAAAVTALAPMPARSQSVGLLNGIGYAALGGTLGIAATAGSGCSGSGLCILPDGMIPAMLAGVVLGGIGGAAINSSAQRTISSGEPLSGGQLAALSVGTVLGGAVLGMVAAGALINGDGTGTFLGSDERTAALMTAAGAGFGVFCLHRQWGKLTGRNVHVQPAVLNDGRPGVVASIRF